MSAPTGLSIVIPSWNGRALLERFLPTVLAAAAAFEAACRQPTEVIVADDASTDDTLEWLTLRYPQVCFAAADDHRGFGPTANRGVAAARYPWVYLLNNDVALAPASLVPLAAHWADPQVFAVASSVYDFASGMLSGAGQIGEFRRGFLSIHRRYFVPEARSPMQAARPWLTLYASGGSSLFHREKFLALGGFDDLLAPFGWEDVELSLRAWKQGYEVRYEPASAVWHQFASTIPARFPRRRVNAIYERNRLLTHWLHLDTPLEITAHLTLLLPRLVGNLLLLRWSSWKAAVQALARVSAVQARRKRLRAARVCELREVLARVADSLGRPEARPLTPETAPVRPWAGAPLAR